MVNWAREIRFLLAGLVLILPPLAPAETFDLVTFAPLRGWQAESRLDSIRFTDADQSKGFYCMPEIYASAPGNGEAGFAGEAPPAPRSRAPGLGASYQIPAGWSRTESNGTVTLSQIVNLGFGLKQDFRLVIMPMERTSGAPLETYFALWKRYVGAIFASPAPPLPLRVRVVGGALLYDGDAMRLLKNNASINGFLYAVLDGGAVLPVMGFFNG
jgi:hypothetical protein